jgi:hypothetical protein
MALDLEKLENVKERGGKTVARCPACAEGGADSAGDHLVIMPDGKWGCIAHPGEHGKEHRRRIAELAGDNANATPRPTLTPRPAPRCVSKRPLPALRQPTAGDLAQIARVRGWPTHDGVEELVHRHMLFVAEVYDAGQHHLAWIATDSTRANAQARRMDGEVWTGIGGCKAKSLPGTTAARCIGASVIGDRPEVWLVEGTPDLLAAPIVAKRAGLDLDHIAFACITGAGNALHLNDLPAFAGKVVTIAVHTDGAGAGAAGKWAAQLYQAGAAEVKGFDFAGIGKDLADYLALKATPSPAAPITSTTEPSPANAKETAPAPAPLVPLDAPFENGKRYRLAGAHEVASRLPLFIQDDRGDTRRAHGVLILDPLPPPPNFFASYL